jgi:acetyl-CoA synthetase
LQLTSEDLRGRVEGGRVAHVITDLESTAKLAFLPPSVTRIAVGGVVAGWRAFDTLQAGKPLAACAATRVKDPLLLYFTSGTTAKPKQVLHTHGSYPIGHLSTLYWIGIRERDVHLNISSPGWAKHAWSSFFAPWNAGATVVAWDYRRLEIPRLVEIMRDEKVRTFCAPPTVWRMLIAGELGARPAELREAVSAGEPLNPEIIDRVKAAWDNTVRDGFGQTESTAQVGNSPGQTVKPGAMGRPLPGYQVALLDAEGKACDEGELSLSLGPAPLGLMHSYADDPERTRAALGGTHYRTGDEARRDADGYYFYSSRADDVFKSADYRLSPFELESALLEHPAVMEAAVVPSPDPIRLNVPKAFIVLRPGVVPGPETAGDIFAFIAQRLSPFQRIRRLEFSELPKTISGKIRRVELRRREAARRKKGERVAHEFFVEEFKPARQ